MRVRTRHALAFFFFSTLLTSGFLVPRMGIATAAPAQPGPAGASSAPSTLILSVVPPKLPADGASYPGVIVSLVSSTGKPTLGLADITVYLTSSQQNVGSVSPKAILKAGRDYAVANFSTTSTPGSTSITASSQGLTATSATLTTVTPSGFPTHLKVIPVPDSLLVNPMGTGTVLVEILDDVGLPAKAVSATAVTLSSSNNNVVNLPASSLTVPIGSVISKAKYLIGVIPGVATITASASGFNSGSGSVSVVGPSPFALKISAQPNPLPTSAHGRLVISLTDPQGNPARAPSDVSVSIRSSSNNVVSAQPTVTIPSGRIYAIAPFSSTANPGTANLTASSPGLKSDFAVVASTQPVTPVKLKLSVAPNPVLADSSGYSSVVVSLTDAGGNPALALFDISVTLTSSNSAVGNINNSVKITSGSSYALATFSSTFFVGSTSITASAQDLLSASGRATSYGPIPSKAVVQSLPNTLPADGGSYPVLKVMLQDASGSPALAPVGVVVQLASSRTNIASVNSSVIIGAGQTYALTNVATTISQGTANITASSSGFDSSSTSMTTISPAPSQLAVYVSPSTAIHSLGSDDALLAVQLQDSNSLPARARQDTSIVVTSSNSTVQMGPLQLSIKTGQDYALIHIGARSSRSGTLTASSGGLASASVTFAVNPLQLSASLTSSSPIVTVGTPAVLSLAVELLGAPLSGANVTFSTTLGHTSSVKGVTDATGQFTDTFMSQQAGVATITAAIYQPLLGNQTVSTTVLVSGASSGTSGGAAGGSLGALIAFLPIVGVVVFLAILGFAMRRIVRTRRASVDGDGDDFDQDEKKSLKS